MTDTDAATERGPAIDEKAGDETDILLCPHCVKPIDRFDHFCPHCAGPVTAHASIDPLGQVFAAGYAYRSATSFRPRGIVVLGMWLIFGPQLPMLGFALFLISTGTAKPAGGQGDYGDLLTLLATGVFILLAMAIYIAILWKTTSHYLNARRVAA